MKKKDDVQEIKMLAKCKDRYRENSFSKKS